MATTKSTLKIVNRIAAFLKLGDAGKLEAFFRRIIKTLTRENTAHKKNIEVIKFNLKTSVDELNDKLADAKEALDETYNNVDITKITNNADQTAYMEVYLTAVSKAKDVIKNIEENLEKKQEEVGEEIKLIEQSIARNNDTLESLK